MKEKELKQKKDLQRKERDLLKWYSQWQQVEWKRKYFFDLWLHSFALFAANSKNCR